MRTKVGVWFWDFTLTAGSLGKEVHPDLESASWLQLNHFGFLKIKKKVIFWGGSFEKWSFAWVVVCFNSKVDNDCFWRMMIARLLSRVSCQALRVWRTSIVCQRCFRLFSFTWHWLRSFRVDVMKVSCPWRYINAVRPWLFRWNIQGLYYPVIWILRGLYQGTSWKIPCDRFFVSLSQKSDIHIVLVIIWEILHHLGCIKPGK